MKPIYVNVVLIDHEKTGKRIRKHREGRGLSLTEVSQRTGLSVSYLSLLERGERQWSEPLFNSIVANME